MPDAMLDIEKSKQITHLHLPPAHILVKEPGVWPARHSQAPAWKVAGQRGETQDPVGTSVPQAHTHTGFLTFGGILGEPLDAPWTSEFSSHPQNPFRAL